MKKKIASLDLLAVLNELKDCCPAKVEKIYQPREKEFLFQFYSPEKGNFCLRVLAGRSIFLSEKRSKMEFPPHFCMFLRKHLNNSHLEKIKQKNFERILELEFERGDEKKILIVELFSKGNLILTDENREILSCLSVQRWRHRTIQTGEKYEYPPKFFISPIGIPFDLFQEHLEKGDTTVKQLAKIGLGGTYAEEIISRTSYKKGEPLTVEDSKELYENFKEILDKVKEGELNPTVYLKNDKPIFYAPFSLKTYSDYNHKKFSSMNEALEFYYKGFEEVREERERERKLEKREEKLVSRLERQRKKREGFEEGIKEAKKKADLIYKHIDIVKGITGGLKKARSKNYSWEEIKEKINKSEYSRYLKEIREHEGEILLNIEGNKVKIDFTVSPTRNAQQYYERKKKLEKKLEGVKEAIDSTKEKIENLSEAVPEEEAKREKPERKWYDKFHNFKTSEGRLVISGKDADTNEELIDKYLEKNDLVFHTKIKGSPFTVLKNGQEASEKEIKQAAVFTASYSRAWKRGLGSIDVYYVKPGQVSKEAPAGEYLPKGSFMIRGKKEFLTVELELAIGLEIEGKEVRIISAPETAIQTKHYGVIRPGESSKLEVSGNLERGLIKEVKKEKKELVRQVKRDEIIQVLPAGGARITKIK